MIGKTAGRRRFCKDDILRIAALTPWSDTPKGHTMRYYSARLRVRNFCTVPHKVARFSKALYRELLSIA